MILEKGKDGVSCLFKLTRKSDGYGGSSRTMLEFVCLNNFESIDADNSGNISIVINSNIQYEINITDSNRDKVYSFIENIIKTEIRSKKLDNILE